MYIYTVVNITGPVLIWKIKQEPKYSFTKPSTPKSVAVS